VGELLGGAADVVDVGGGPLHASPLREAQRRVCAIGRVRTEVSRLAAPFAEAHARLLGVSPAAGAGHARGTAGARASFRRVLCGAGCAVVPHGAKAARRGRACQADHTRAKPKAQSLVLGARSGAQARSAPASRSVVAVVEPFATSGCVDREADVEEEHAVARHAPGFSFGDSRSSLAAPAMRPWRCRVSRSGSAENRRHPPNQPRGSHRSNH
jgi:hypothetical protein